jgi:hypothetical protein
MFAEVVGCTMFASSIFLTYALIVVVSHLPANAMGVASRHARPYAGHAPGTIPKAAAGAPAA